MTSCYQLQLCILVKQLHKTPSKSLEHLQCGFTTSNMNKLEIYGDSKVNVERVSIIEKWFKEHKSLPEKIGKTF